MPRQALLLTIGAAPLPDTTPIVPVTTTPTVNGHVSTALAPPTGLAGAVTFDAVQLSWLANGVAGSEYVVEWATDAAGLPGTYRRLAVTGDLYYTAALAGPHWLRVRSQLNGRLSAPTAAQLFTPLSSDDFAADSAEALAAALEAQAGVAQEIIDRQLSDADAAIALGIERAERQAAVTAAQGRINAILSDSIISQDEKPQLILDYQALINERDGIATEAAASDATDEMADYDAALGTLTGYLATLTTPTRWDDASGITYII